MIKKGDNGGNPLLLCDNITYRVGDFSIKSLSLQLNKGEYLALLGPSGSGKSVLLELISGLRRVASGRIYLNGDDITYLSSQKRDIGILFQDYALFPNMNVFENIAYSLSIRNISKREIIQRVDEMAERLSIAQLLTRDTLSLSGGERQRVALSRTLIMSPQLLLLDEPTSALDEDLRSSSLSLLKGLSENGLSIIHVTHNLSEAEVIADRIEFMANIAQ